jgi:hypothetical protein
LLLISEYFTLFRLWVLEVHHTEIEMSCVRNGCTVEPSFNLPQMFPVV